MQITKEEIKQYSRHLNLDEVGVDGQLRLKQAKVLVVGAGGLGCPVLQYLVAAGVGQIGVIDDDIVSQSNLQRQVLYSFDDIGRSKVFSAKYRLGLLNPYIEIKAYDFRLNTTNAIKLFETYDLIADCTDNLATRYLVNDAAVMSNKPFVYSAIHKFEGQVSVFNFQDGPTYRCLFPQPPTTNEVPNCEEIGVLGVLPGIIGCLQANEVLKIILRKGIVLSGQLLTYDCLKLEQSIFRISKNPNSHVNRLMDNYDHYCSQIGGIKYADYKRNQGDYHLIDVRSKEERLESFIPNSLHFPLSDLLEKMPELPGDKKLLFVCKSGSRSKLAIQRLQNEGFDSSRLLNLSGGMIKIEP